MIYNYNKLTPFKKYIIQNFPFIDADFDALTNYQLYCKIVEYLNKVIDSENGQNEQIELLTDAFNNLHDYVENYFANLDVQEEIDNKLDDMVEQGTLQEIVADYLNSKAVFGFDSVAEMKAATNLINGSYAKTYGYYEKNDGGDGFYKIRTRTYDDVVDNGSIILMESSDSLVAELLNSKNICVKQFGAKGDGETDDTQAIQNAFDSAKDGDSIYFTKMNESTYVIEHPIKIEKNDLSIYSSPKSEYYTKILTEKSINMFEVTGYGITFDNIVLQGNGDTDTKSTTNGIVFDRSSLGDDETYSNIDSIVNNCNFMYLKDCIKIKGRNLTVKNSSFVISHRGIYGELFTYGNNTAEFRGIRILNNRFHSMNAYLVNETTAPTLSNFDSWCIEMPLTTDKPKHIEISNNNYDYCLNGFYKGTLASSIISNNINYLSLPLFIYSDADSDLKNAMGNVWGLINGNLINGLTRSNPVFANIQENFMILNNCMNLKITDNAFRDCNKQAIKISNSYRSIVSENSFLYFGHGSSDNYACIDIDTSPMMTVKNNFISNTVSGNTGIKSNSTTFLANNIIDTNVSTKLDISATNILSHDVAISWITPTFQNNFVAAAGNKGYRKHENGLVDVYLIVSGGTDNGVVCTLPDGFRPSYNIRIANVCIWQGQATNDSAYAEINANGNININFDSGLSSPASKNFIINVSYFAN